MIPDAFLYLIFGFLNFFADRLPTGGLPAEWLSAFSTVVTAAYEFNNIFNLKAALIVVAALIAEEIVISGYLLIRKHVWGAVPGVSGGV